MVVCRCGAINPAGAFLRCLARPGGLSLPDNTRRAGGIYPQRRGGRQAWGNVIVGTFGPEGPTKCSGLEVVRYDADSLHGEFGARFRLVESSSEIHETPFGTQQQFLYCYCTLEQ